MLVTPFEESDRGAVETISRIAAAEVDFAAERGRTWSRIWVARPSEEQPPIAYLLAWFVADEVHVINVATHPDARRRGAASELLKALLEAARSQRSRLVLLEVRRSNRAAIALYRAHGFTAMGVRKKYYEDNAEDAVEMMIELDPETGAVVPHRDELDLGALANREPED